MLQVLTTEPDRASYLQTVQAATAPGSVAVIATFSPDGPQQCSGLPVARHSVGDSTDFFGSEWAVIADARKDYETPAGVRQPFTWATLRRG